MNIKMIGALLLIARMVSTVSDTVPVVPTRSEGQATDILPIPDAIYVAPGDHDEEVTPNVSAVTLRDPINRRGVWQVIVPSTEPVPSGLYHRLAGVLVRDPQRQS